MKFKSFYNFALIAGLAFSVTSCDKDDNDLNQGESDNKGDNIETTSSRKFFNVVVGIDVENSGSTYSAAYSSLSSADTYISFNNWGFIVPSVRTARVYASNAGDYLYNLSYGGGTISKYSVSGGETYGEIKTLDISLAMGTKNPRWTKLNEKYASLHNVATEHIYSDAEKTQYSYTNAQAILTAVDLESFSIILDASETGGSVLDFPRTQEDIDNNLHAWRIDAPVVTGGKAFYGVNKRSYDVNTATNISTSDYFCTTLVVDYPSLSNPQMITSSVAKGSTQGYRTPVMHVDSKNDIYQITAAPSHILKITNGDYDNAYDFDLSAALSMNAGALGWFYVGDGIGYVPFYDIDRGSGSDVAAWGVARIDVYNKTAVKLNLPENLWLYQYQNGVVEDGIFYMAIAPLGGEGNIYMFDVTSDSPDAFTLGARIKTIDTSSAYLGVF